jgi:peptide-methionine (S)-S-oxide reductase
MSGLLALLLALHGDPLVRNEQVAVFAGGCFWGVEAVFEHVKGVVRVTSGYSGGRTTSPTYEDVSDGGTGHAESVQIVFDPAQISYAKLMEIFFSVAHDPTQLDRQGPDVGTQYRSAIFYLDDAQKHDAEAYVAQLTKAHKFAAPIVTQIAQLRAFYTAEEYHQDFAEKHPLHPYILIHDRPKVAELKRRFPELYREVTKTAAR